MIRNYLLMAQVFFRHMKSECQHAIELAKQAIERENNILEIFCDASMDDITKLCAWACIMRCKDKSMTYSGHRIWNTSAMHGELLAAKKALNYVKGFMSGKRVTAGKIVLYSDHQDLVDKVTQLVKGQPYKEVTKNMCDDNKRLYESISHYISTYDLQIQKIDRANNPAHKFAYSELQKARKGKAQRDSKKAKKKRAQAKHKLYLHIVVQ